MVTLRRTRIEESRHIRGTDAPRNYTEFRVITLKEPVVDPQWMFHHPRFQREAKTSESLPHITPGFLKNTKKISSRVPSARVNARSRILCERRERNQGNSACRHFCELLGPNLCKDCWKLAERSDAVKEHRNSCQSDVLIPRGKDPFSVMIASRDHEKRIEYNESEEEFLDETEDEEFISKSPTSGRKRSSVILSHDRHDSGYSSRMSYIRSLSRTPSGDFCPRSKSPLKPSTREGTILDDERQREIPASTDEITSKVDPTPIWKNAYLTKLREREAFKDVLNNLYLPLKMRHAWRELPVTPVVMDLKLINFTIYDGSPLNKRAVSKKATAEK